MSALKSPPLWQGADLPAQAAPPLLRPARVLQMQAPATAAPESAVAVRAAIDAARALLLSDTPEAALQAFADAARLAKTSQLPALAAAARHGLGLLVLAWGRHQTGLHILAKVLRSFTDQSLPGAANEVARDLADACLRLQLLPEAQRHRRRLIDSLQGQGDVQPLPWLWLQQARAQAAAGQADAALSSLDWAQAMFSQRQQPQGWAWAELARLSLRLAGTPSPAQAALAASQAQALQARLSGAPLLQARWLQARAHRQAGALSAALALLPTLCGPQAQAAAPWLHARAWAEAGQAHLALGDQQAASAALEQAITRLDDLHAALPLGPGAPADWPCDDGGLQQACAARLALAARHESAEQALHWLHHQRLRQLRPCLGGADILGLADASQRPRLAGLRMQHAWLQRQLQRVLEDGRPDPDLGRQHALQRAEQALLDCTRRLRRTRWPGAPAQRGEDAPLDIDALRQHFQGGRALVAYGALDGRLLALVIAQGQVQQLHLPTRLVDLEAALQRLHQQLASFDHGGAPSADAATLELAHCTQRLQTLHRLVWAPLQTTLGPACDVVVVPSAALQRLPFAALHDGSDWLDQRCRLRLAATVAAARRGSGSPGAALQAPPRSATPQTREDLAAALLTPGLLQLACPVRLHAGNPAFSGWCLGDGSLVTTADLDAGTARAPLVLLAAAGPAAARTRGDPSAGVSGMSGAAPLALVLALQRAGTPEVIDCLWPVADAIHTSLLGALTAAAAGTPGLCSAAALQQARAAMRGEHPHPAVWAAFCLHGGQPAPGD